jgi:hypothetical protein
MGADRASAEGAKKLVKNVTGAFCQDFHRAVPPVADPTSHPQLAGQPLDKITKSNALDTSFELDMQTGYGFI